MQNTAAKIQCLNHNCQAFNSQKNDFCQKCRTPIVKRYLWAIGDEINAYEVGELIDNRYLSIEKRIVLDTKPGLTPLVPEKIPKEILPYLQLFSYRLHVPQIYGHIFSHQDQPESEIWLLEYGTVPIDSSGELKYPDLLPKISQVWQEATALRQLNWLWQIAQLWDLFQNKGVAKSLVNPSLLRANGAIVQLLELELDEGQPPSLSELGKLWQELAPNSSPNISKFLQQLGSELQAGKIKTPERAIAILDEAMYGLGRSQERAYEIFALSDSGPSRSHNEDSCFPNEPALIEIDSYSKALAIVCDGIGGHAGGEIASQLAIDTVQKAIEELPLGSEASNPEDVISHLNKLTCIANDIISERNDSEKRHERQRMGTTLVMTLAHAHQMYLTHVGDSRIYWITATGCHQVTVDDDLASREVQLGYAFYRDIIEFPHSGALVQALGMESSANLNPTVERLILDEDCVFLLCSDGLSDYGRVEQHWRGEILPILHRQTDVTSAGKRLIQIGNHENGHDNVTVALVYCQVQPAKAGAETPLSFSQILSSLPNRDTVKPPSNPNPQPSQKSSRRLWPLLAIVGIFLTLGGVSYLFPALTNPFVDRVAKPSSRPAIAKRTTPSKNPPVLKTTVESELKVGETIKIQEAIVLWPNSEKTAKNQQAVGRVPEGSILKVIKKNPTSPGMLLEVCQIPPTPLTKISGSTNRQTVKPISQGKTGWIQAEAIERRIDPKFDPTNNSGKCKLPNAEQPSVRSPQPAQRPAQPKK